MNLIEAAQQNYATQLRQVHGSEKEFRARAWAEFERLGFPERSGEAWKYTSLAPLLEGQWKLAEPGQSLPLAAQVYLHQYADQFAIGVFVNGVLRPESSQLSPADGFELQGSSGGPLNFADGLISLAAAVHQGGYQLRVPPGVHIQKPLLLIHCQTGEGTWLPTLNHLQMGENSGLQLVEVFVGDAGVYLRTDLSRAEVGRGARLTWIRLQMEGAGASHLNEVQVQLAVGSELALTQLNSGGDWSRGNLQIELQEEFAAAHIQGLAFGGRNQHIDQRVELRHLAGQNTSTQLFKGVLKDRARGVLNGKIHIAAHAQKVVSSQLNHNLLLSRQAEADTKPELEIFADDVKANHGASVGRLDKDKLFYLLSRGIGRNEAARMLARAFADDVLMRIPARALRDFMTTVVEKLLPAFMSEMEMSEMELK